MTTNGHPLDIDMGNSRTKWRCGPATGSLPSPQLPRLAQAPSRVRIATVLGNREQVACAVESRFGVAAEFASVAPCLGGVKCGYEEPSRLGVDRWLATVAAWQQVRCATAVVSAGTAMTIDFVHANGRHEGGYIVPGLRLSRQALDGNTAELRVADSETASVDAREVPRDTQAGVALGTVLMLSAFVNTAVASFASRCEGDPVVFLSGGDAPVLATHLTTPVRQQPHLVLDGLAIALP